MDCEPPFLETYKTLFKNFPRESNEETLFEVDECELPTIDLGQLDSEIQNEKEKCKKDISEAAREWGFFQVINHGIPQEVLETMQCEQVKLFHQPFKKKSEENYLNLSANSYRWGNPMATCLRQFSWSEAYHLPLSDISKLNNSMNLRSSMEAFAGRISRLAERLAEILAAEMGVEPIISFHENFPQRTSYLRMNRYPPCPFPFGVFGLMPHTDSDFLTIVYQDNVGGLQLMKDGTWFSVSPNPQSLIVNIGDLFQALSNGIYKSIKHRVIAAKNEERYSVAYFYCPSYDAMIEGCTKPSLYRNFSFSEYKEQIRKDVMSTGDKVGLSRFLL